jgi:hypothetical protein
MMMLRCDVITVYIYKNYMIPSLLSLSNLLRCLFACLLCFAVAKREKEKKKKEEMYVRESTNRIALTSERASDIALSVLATMHTMIKSTSSSTQE